MSLLAFLLRRSRGVVALAAVAGAVGGAAGVALIALIHAQLGRSEPSPGAIGSAFAGLCLLAVGARVVSQVAMVRLGQGAVKELGLHLARKVLALPMERFEAAGPGGLLAVLTGDILAVANALVGIPLLCINGPMVAACLVYAGWLSPAILGLGVLVAAFAIGVFLALGSRAQRRLRAARAGQDVLVGQMRALIDGFRELKVHRSRRESFLSEALEPAAEVVRDRNAAGLALFAAAEGWAQLAFFGFLGVVLFVLPAFASIPRPTLSGIVLIVLYIMTPLDVILTWVPILGRARASIQRIEALIPTLESDLPASFAAIEPPAESVELRGVRFAYPPDSDGSRFELGPISLALRPGELVILAGGNGSGKTTLVKLVAGLYEPHAGSIRVDGRAVGPDEREGYRQLVSVVFADGYLFDRLHGLDGVDLDGRARDGLERLGLSGRVGVEAGAFSTIDLSQGQRRRLALLTALLEDRPVCILDEWAANQDAHAKRFFYLELLPELRAAGKALLVISHDEEYHDVADRVVRLRDGRIAGDDEPAALAPAQGSNP